MTPADFEPLLKKLDREARGVRQHRQLERSVPRGAVGARADDRDRDAHRRGAVRDAVRRLLRRRARRRRRRRGQEPAHLGARGVRLRQARGGAAYEQRRHHARPSTRCSTTAATRGQRRSEGRTARTGRVAAVLSLGTARPATRCRPIRRCARCTRSGATSSAASKAEADEGRHGPADATRRELEKLLTELALKSKQIRELEGRSECEAAGRRARRDRRAGLAGGRRRVRASVARGAGGRELGVAVQGNTPYDGRVRVRAARVRRRVRPLSALDRRRRQPPWSHDYPDGEVHFIEDPRRADAAAHPRPTARTSWRSTIRSCSTIRSPTWPSPGFWAMTTRRRRRSRELPAQGRLRHLRRLPRRRLGQPAGADAAGAAGGDAGSSSTRRTPIFHSFFEIDAPATSPPSYGRHTPSYCGLFEDNDPTKRLMAIANVNTDITEYWEFSDTGIDPVD